MVIVLLVCHEQMQWRIQMQDMGREKGQYYWMTWNALDSNHCYSCVSIMEWGTITVAILKMLALVVPLVRCLLCYNSAVHRFFTILP